jgi:hypothetical protein
MVDTWAGTYLCTINGTRRSAVFVQADMLQWLGFMCAHLCIVSWARLSVVFVQADWLPRLGFTNGCSYICAVSGARLSAVFVQADVLQWLNFTCAHLCTVTGMPPQQRARAR